MSARGVTLDAAVRRVEERRAESAIRRCRSCGRQLFGRGSVCRSRRCPEYGPVWAGDQRQKLFRNLETLPGNILLSAVTAPGAGLLPWDTQQCAALGEHRHSGKLGCRVCKVAAREWNESAADRWRRLHRRAYQDAVKRVGKRSVFLVARVWEMQARGVLHVHPVLAYGTARQMVGARCNGSTATRPSVWRANASSGPPPASPQSSRSQTQSRGSHEGITDART